MILKTAANYNDEGGYIEAWKNSDGTTEVKLIPKSGGDEGKQGLKSISISPAITTTPALDSLFPIYWEDLTEEEKANGKSLTVYGNITTGTTYSFTVTPTSDWYVYAPGTGFLGKGEPFTVAADENGGKIELAEITASETTTPSDDSKHITIKLTIELQQ